jgi:arylsulfatase A-like enzyme
MKAIFILFDSLAKNYLPCYGNDWGEAPNFKRLAEKSVTFDNCYVGSMPCMPARRELHTGRHNFLHRAWGPLEPFDDSMPEILKNNGIYSHLSSDHQHYWEDGGCTYHVRYSSWEIARGQEGDPWKGEVKDPEVPEHFGNGIRQDWINRKLWTEKGMSQTKVFNNGLEFIDNNHDQDNWFLQVECFDPHPPFFAPQKYRDIYGLDADEKIFDYPFYAPVGKGDSPELIELCRKNYASLVSMCDYSLGRVLDAMDKYELWDDTMLILTTDHGFHLGENNWWAFVNSPFYDQVCRKPLFIWDPRCRRRNERCRELVQTHDLPATLLEYFKLERPKDMQGKVLRDTVAHDKAVRDALIFGHFGGQVNCSDGRYVYMRAPLNPDSSPLYNYTLMPTHMHSFFSLEELHSCELAEPFSFTKGCKILKTKAKPFMSSQYENGTVLYDLESDPGQKKPLQDKAVEAEMIRKMCRLMRENDAPEEQFTRLGLS